MDRTRLPVRDADGQVYAKRHAVVTRAVGYT